MPCIENHDLIGRDQCRHSFNLKRPPYFLLRGSIQPRESILSMFNGGAFKRLMRLLHFYPPMSSEQKEPGFGVMNYKGSSHNKPPFGVITFS